MIGGKRRRERRARVQLKLELIQARQAAFNAEEALRQSRRRDVGVWGFEPRAVVSEAEALQRYKDATAGYYDSVPEGYHVVEDLDGERLVLNPQPPTPYVRAAVGDRVRCTLEGVLTDYSADDGIWTLRGCSIEGHVEWEYQLHWGTTFTPVSATPEAATERCEHGQTEWHEVVVTPLYEHRICPGPPTSTPEAATRDEKLVQLKLTQMRAAVVQCCNAGREAYPDPCPCHGPKGQQS